LWEDTSRLLHFVRNDNTRALAGNDREPRLLRDFIPCNDRQKAFLRMIRVVTNWSQKGSAKEVAKGVEAETLYSKEIAGAPGRTRTHGLRFRKPMATVNQSQ